MKNNNGAARRRVDGIDIRGGGGGVRKALSVVVAMIIAVFFRNGAEGIGSGRVFAGGRQVWGDKPQSRLSMRRKWMNKKGVLLGTMALTGGSLFAQTDEGEKFEATESAIESAIEHINVYLWQGIPAVVQGLVIALVFVILLRKQIKARPVAFYIYPVMILLLSVLSTVVSFLPGGRSETFIESLILHIPWWFNDLGLVTRWGIGILIIVMFIGVLPKTTFVKNLFVIRTEMSIIGATLLGAHGIIRIPTAISFMTGRSAPIIFFFIYGILAWILLAFLLPSWITSFRFVRKKMKAGIWKKLQTYTGVPLFIVMLVFGLVLNWAWSVGWYPNFAEMEEITEVAWNTEEYSSPMALYHGVFFAETLLSAKVYAALLVSYIILRIKKYKKSDAVTPV